ncbi:MAG: hypothetical protein AAGG50_20935 [Bacteroidota bacterium]
MARTARPLAPFSWGWMFASMAAFVGIELVLGALVGGVLLGNAFSYNLRFLLQGLLNVSSYFLGGLLIGALSPGLRLREPAVGAFLAVALMLSLTALTPFRFIGASGWKLLLGGGIAFALALVGAALGEKLTGQKLPG